MTTHFIVLCIAVLLTINVFLIWRLYSESWLLKRLTKLRDACERYATFPSDVNRTTLIAEITCFSSYRSLLREAYDNKRLVRSLISPPSRNRSDLLGLILLLYLVPTTYMANLTVHEPTHDHLLQLLMLVLCFPIPYIGEHVIQRARSVMLIMKELPVVNNGVLEPLSIDVEQIRKNASRIAPQPPLLQPE